MKRFCIGFLLIATSPAYAGTQIPYHWNGFYAGLNAGAVKHTMDITDNQATTFLATMQQTSDPFFTGGFQVGYRHQLDFNQASGVYGLELSADFSNTRFAKTYGSPFALYQFNATHTLKGVGLLQLIGGVAVNDTLLFFAAGISKTTISGNVIGVNGVPFFDTVHLGKDVVGTALGAGIEYAFNPSLSARFKVDVISPNGYNAFDSSGDSFRIENHIAQGTVGLNWKFL